MSDTEKKPQHIISLKAENVKRLSAVEITPKGDVVVIGGQNGAGKSSVLDSIEYALGGKESLCKEPIRRGEESARIVLETEEYIIERTFTKSGGSYIKVKNHDDMAFSTPQSLLDKLVGDLSFDPLAFTRMDGKKQLEVFMRLLGLDFTEIDKQRAEIYEERRQIGRDAGLIEPQIKAIPEDPGAPTEEVSVSELVKQLEEAQNTNRGIDDLLYTVQQAERKVENCTANVDRIKAELDRAQMELASATTERDAAKAKATGLAKIDTAPISDKLNNAEAINKRVQQAKRRAELQTAFDAKKQSYDECTEGISAIDSAKQEAIASAKFPVDGVTFGEDGILVNGIPFDQASSAEQLRIATAMGLSGNPELRIILIRDGSLLDDKSLAAMAEMAAQFDAQVWCERVSEGAEVSVIIEDGMVKENRMKGAAPEFGGMALRKFAAGDPVTRDHVMSVWHGVIFESANGVLMVRRDHAPDEPLTAAWKRA